MEYLSLYRKYRPRKFADVVGQEHVVQTLINSIKADKVNHAYLFSGPRGVGKTTLAKLLASSLNCFHKVDVEPCDDCIVSFDSQLDIIEIDAATHNKVENVRKIIANINSAPTYGRYKIYIIDEVHMFSSGAFDSMLKTLEEPPKDVVFIFATTDPQKIKPTFLSRVTRLNFSLLSQDVIIKHLEKVLKKEKISFEPNTLEYIAKLSSGGMRDALTIADQSISYGNNIIKLEDLFKQFRIISNESVIEILNALNINDFATLINEMQNLYRSGIEPYNFLNSVINVLRDFIIYKITKNSSHLSVLFKEQINFIHFNKEKAESYIFKMYDLINSLYYIENKFEFIQMKFVELAMQKPVKIIDEITKLKKALEEDNNIEIDVMEEAVKIKKLSELEYLSLLYSKDIDSSEQAIKLFKQIVERVTSDMIQKFPQLWKQFTSNDNDAISTFNSLLSLLQNSNVIFAGKQFVLISSIDEYLAELSKDENQLKIEIIMYFLFNDSDRYLSGSYDEKQLIFITQNDYKILTENLRKLKAREIAKPDKIEIKYKGTISNLIESQPNTFDLLDSEEDL
ncbi:DNA polymerase III subunit gamma/tau [Mycoplasma phocimorsus]|uniref:DNA polymerase III subunit gamma/tau n=1 Tax=Mycoplasma phocimorsus TaxID=3045839 RepID=UPI0024C00A63|nr:DNA polymerase III subunit gamma/tau [Mycoplasma phocimorsus]MDJ1647470.1 DNA polymerase III subunit gamma/tau [Mycoplasma phocimorsus]